MPETIRPVRVSTPCCARSSSSKTKAWGAGFWCGRREKGRVSTSQRRPIPPAARVGGFHALIIFHPNSDRFWSALETALQVENEVCERLISVVHGLWDRVQNFHGHFRTQRELRCAPAGTMQKSEPGVGRFPRLCMKLSRTSLCSGLEVQTHSVVVERAAFYLSQVGA